MTNQQIADAVACKTVEQQSRWLRDLSWELTVCARAVYAPGGESGDARQLVAFNELQHRINSYMRRPDTADPWPIEQLLDTLLATAAHYGIGAALEWALNRTLESPA